MEERKLTKEEFKEIYSRVPRICVDLIIKTREGILFTKRSIEPFKGAWHLPGGRLLFNESLENAAKRIAEREVGLKIKILNFLGYLEFPREICSDYERHSVSIVFLAEANSDEVKLNDEAEDFLISKEIPSNFIKNQKEFLEKYMKSYKSKLY